jgi:predicted nuclease of predicted toxin-antitoxin system
MKFLVDMNLSPGWIDLLVKSGFQAVHWSTIGRGNEADAELMRWAAEHAHVVLTADLDFGAILAATQRRKPSVIQIRTDLPTAAVAGAAVLSAIRQARDELERGAIVSVNIARARLRVLPFSAP